MDPCVQVLEPALKVCLVVLPGQTIHPLRGVLLAALFAGFTATMAGSDFPRPCIISSFSRCGPGQIFSNDQTRDIPVSDAILVRVMCSSTPAGRHCLA